MAKGGPMANCSPASPASDSPRNLESTTSRWAPPISSVFENETSQKENSEILLHYELKLEPTKCRKDKKGIS